MSEAAKYWSTQGRNFMTPNIISYHDLANGLMVELSGGTGFNNEPIFGVSVADKEGERDYELSQMFYTRSDAQRYITTIGKG